MIVNRLSAMLVKTAGRSAGAMRRDRRGNVAITFALMAVPLIAMVGLGVDYYRLLSDKARLDTAADAAALAAINTMMAYINANSQSLGQAALTSNAEAAGAKQALSVFKANAGTAETVAPVTPNVTLGPDATNALMIDATVTYSAQTPAVFGGLVGINTLNISGQSHASLTMGSYQDFYLVLDVSGSMGLPTATADQATLADGNSLIGHNPSNIPKNAANDPKNPGNPDNQYYRSWQPTATPPQYAGYSQGAYGGDYPNGCMFACHYVTSASSNYVFTGFTFAEANNLKLRVDSLASAILNLLNYAQSVATQPDQYSFGVYPFIVNAVKAAPTDSAALAAAPGPGQSASSDFQSLLTLFTPTPSPGGANQYLTPFASTYLDNGTSNGSLWSIGSGGTHFENLWPSFQNGQWLQGSGIGTSTAHQGFIFLVTDGADNSQIFTQSNGWTGSNPQPPPSPTSSSSKDFCQNAKNAHYTVAVLLIPYVNIPLPPPSSNEYYEDYQANGISQPPGSSQIEAWASACATAGFYAKASTDADITTAIQNLFKLAQQKARLTQ
jgi:Flp pilus assembly protein TadG